MNKVGLVGGLALVLSMSGCSLLDQGKHGRGGGVDKSADTVLMAQNAALSAKFQKLSFVDPVNGNEMQYNLFIPENYDSNKSYPLVVFMADGSTTGKGIESPLLQGWGGHHLGHRC